MFMLHFLTTATEPAAPAGGLMSPIIMVVAMLAIMYFLMIRPESKRKKEAEQMRNAMKIGDEIITIGGICGKIVHLKDDKFVIETGAERAREEAKKAQEARAKAKAAKKAEKAGK